MQQPLGNMMQKLKEISHNKGVKLGLSSMYKMCQAFKDPQNLFPTVLVAGTNGKGSTCFKMAKAFELSSKKVGLLSSPHLFSLQERIQINGEWISEERLSECLEKIFQAQRSLGIELTFFELLTLSSFLYFAEEKVDIAIIEIGLGGRLDAANVIHKPKICVITQVDFDHMAILGNTRVKIAKEKAGILRQGVPVVLGYEAQNLGIEELAEKVEADIIAVPKAQNHEAQNTEIARRALQELYSRYPEFNYDDRGLEKRPPCRFEERSFQGKIPLVFDVAHNRSSLAALYKELKQKYPGFKVTTVLALSHRPDADLCASIIEKNSDACFLLDVNHERLMPQEVTQKFFQHCRLLEHSNLAKQLYSLMSKPEEEKRVFVFTGSFYLMSFVFKALEIPQKMDPEPIQETFALPQEKEKETCRG